MNQVNKEILKRAAKGIGLLLLSVAGLSICFAIITGTGWCFCKMDINCDWRSSDSGMACIAAAMAYISIGFTISACWDWYKDTKKEVEASLSQRRNK